jgi:hypothetical protein
MIAARSDLQFNVRSSQHAEICEKVPLSLKPKTYNTKSI